MQNIPYASGISVYFHDMIINHNPIALCKWWPYRMIYDVFCDLVHHFCWKSMYIGLCVYLGVKTNAYCIYYSKDSKVLCWMWYTQFIHRYSMTLYIWVYNTYERRVYNGYTQKDNWVYNSVCHAKVCFQLLSVYVQWTVMMWDANHKRNVKTWEQYGKKRMWERMGKMY